MDKATSGTVAGPELAEAIHQVATAAGRDDALPSLTGIQAEITDDTITFAATDRYRFALRPISWTPAAANGATTQTTLPAESLAEAAKILATDDQVHLTLPASHGVLGPAGRTPTLTLTLRAMDGQLPDPKKLWPTGFTATADLDTADLADAVKRMALVAEPGHPVKLHLTDGALALSAGTADDASAATRSPPPPTCSPAPPSPSPSTPAASSTASRRSRRTGSACRSSTPSSRRSSSPPIRSPPRCAT
nr:DNA polymerase III subunit beta [Streptomyces sp. NRRL S-87]